MLVDARSTTLFSSTVYARCDVTRLFSTAPREIPVRSMMWFHRRADFVVAWKVHDHRAGYDVVFLKLKTDSERPTWFAMHVDESAGMKGSRTVVGIANLVQLVVRDGNGCFYRQDSTEEAIRWLAAASIDPIDLAELREGWKSFELFDPNPRCPRWRRLAELPDADAWSGQQIWIDLLRRAIWVDSPHVPAETQGVACQDHPGGGGTSVAAKFILSSDLDGHDLPRDVVATLARHARRRTSAQGANRT
ncbi:MAG: hypothetical protein R3B96_15600 [Pirellulaceae bacterium]